MAILIGLSVKKFENFNSLRIFSSFFLLIIILFSINFYILIYERGGSNYDNLKKYRDIESTNNKSFFFNEFKSKNLAIKASLKKEDDRKIY